MLASTAEKLPDQLQENLRLVFVGTAASTRSAEVGHYYAHPGNRFWRTIHQVGLTPRLYEPREFTALLQFGIGFTDLCKSGAGMDHQALAFPVDIPAFREKIRRYRPKTIAFTSKRAASMFYGRPTRAVALGRQPTSEGFPEIFVLASPSGAASGSWSVHRPAPHLLNPCGGGGIFQNRSDHYHASNFRTLRRRRSCRHRTCRGEPRPGRFPRHPLA